MFLLTGCFFFPAMIHSQTTKGRLLLGVSSRYGFTQSGQGDLMSIGFSTTTRKIDSPNGPDYEKSHYFRYNLAPRAGIFVINNLVTGIDLLASVYENTEYINNQFSFAAGPFARYYFPVKKVRPFVEASTALGVMKYQFDMDEDITVIKTNIFIISAGAGAAFIVSDRVTLDLLAGYSSYREKQKENNPNNYRTITGTLGMRFGISVYLGKNKAKA